jgi:hypothetical protein
MKRPAAEWQAVFFCRQALHVLPALGLTHARKMFFSEERNQKTFILGCRGPDRQRKHLNRRKSFTSFLRAGGFPFS